MNTFGLFICGILVVAPFFDASAAPVKRRDGQACASTGTARKDATQDGKKINCLFDTCTYTKCKETDGKIDTTKCSTVTEHSNARDCKPVKSTPISGRPGSVFILTRPGGNQLAPTKDKPRFPPLIGKFQTAPVINAPTTNTLKKRLFLNKFKKLKK
ncbi:MAG: hypothetical protein ACTSUY_11510 [Alphaproteobacteria bacterium]